LFAARQIEATGDTLVSLGIFELTEGSEALAVAGSLKRLSDVQLGIFRKWLLPGGRAGEGSAVIEYHLVGDYYESCKNQGFASRMAELLLEAAGRMEIRRIFGELPYDEDTRRLDPEKSASMHILTKNGFEKLSQTRWEAYNSPRIYMARDL